VKFLVLSYRHYLLPFAWRLKRDGHEVQVAQVSSKGAYAQAWAGRFESILPPGVKVDDRDTRAVREAVEMSSAVVLTDSTRWSEAFDGYSRLWGVSPSPEPVPAGLVVGGWFDGSVFAAPHLIIEDVGAWTGGQGPLVPAAATLIRLRDGPFVELLEREADALKARSFRGLVSVGTVFTPDGTPSRVGLQAGWKFLHSHLFVSELERFAGLFDGEPASLPKRYVVGAIVSVPPWPGRPADPGFSRPILVRPREIDPAIVRASTFWHDMQVEGDTARTVGLDGLVAVVRGAGDTLPSARVRCWIRTESIQIPERQYRADAGTTAERFLELLEAQGKLGLLGEPV
jgi:hypothetical protein